MIKRIIELSASLLVAFWDLTTDLLRDCIGRERPSRVAILYYHSVAGKQAFRFGKQMDLLKRIAIPVSLLDIAKCNRPGRYICVTFDDGFESFRSIALPELVSRKIPATVFVTTCSLGKQPQWMRELDTQLVKETVLSKDEIRELSVCPIITVGSHCVTHKRLTELSPEELQYELAESKSTLESLTGKSVNLLSFPHGCHNKAVLECSKKTGYSRVFSIDSDGVLAERAGYVLGRIKVSMMDWPIELSLKTLGAFRWQSTVSRFLRRHLQIGAKKNG